MLARISGNPDYFTQRN